MEIFKHVQETSHMSIFVLSDLHIGNANHNPDALKKAIGIIQRTSKDRDVMVMLNGDVVDSINLSDKRFNPTEVDRSLSIRDLKNLAKKQADVFLEAVNPISHHIKYAVIGNHEETNVKYNHFDVYDYYCNEIGCTKLGYLALGKIVVSDKHDKTGTLDMAITHGRGGGGGSTIGYPINYARGIFNKYNVDIGVVGHIHKLVAIPEPSKVTLNKACKLVKTKKWLCVAGCFLETHTEGNSGYFEGKQGELSQLGFLEIMLDLSGHWRLDVKCHDLDC